MIPGVEIVPADHSGGANTSHTIVVDQLTTLLAAVDRHAPFDAYEHAVIEDNVLGKDTVASRKRTFRYLRELYLLRPESLLFRALRDLWPEDPAGRPLIAGLCALARDASFRASSGAILESTIGAELTNHDLAVAVQQVFPDAYSPATLAKVGRNTFSSWEQTGHLRATQPGAKVRVRAVCTPAALAFALLLGHFEGAMGGDLFDTKWALVCDQPRGQLLDLATVASQRSLIDLRQSAGVVEVRFSELLRPIEGMLL